MNRKQADKNKPTQRSLADYNFVCPFYVESCQILTIGSSAAHRPIYLMPCSLRFICGTKNQPTSLDEIRKGYENQKAIKPQMD